MSELYIGSEIKPCVCGQVTMTMHAKHEVHCCSKKCSKKLDKAFKQMEAEKKKNEKRR